MKIPPDDTTLALWLDDELEGEQLALIESWAADHPEQLAAREEVRRWRRMIGESLPASEEPPAGEFFNERIQHSIREASVVASTHPRSRNQRSWGRIWMPLAACAGMVLAFWLGALLQPHGQMAGDTPTPTTPHLYTPEQGVDAQWISSTDASATVIVLTGVTAIPDEVDFTATALHRGWREFDSTAAMETETDSE